MIHKRCAAGNRTRAQGTEWLERTGQALLFEENLALLWRPLADVAGWVLALNGEYHHPVSEAF